MNYVKLITEDKMLTCTYLYEKFFIENIIFTNKLNQSIVGVGMEG